MSAEPNIVQFQKKIDDALPGSAGGGHYGGMPSDGNDARLARVEADVSNIKTTLADLRTDLRDLTKKVDAQFLLGLGALAAVAIGLAGLMAKGFKWF